MKSHTRCCGAIAAMLGAAGWLVAPMAAHATLVTFDWVPASELPASGLPYSGPSTANGSITLNISGWAFDTTPPPPGPPNTGPYYTSGSAVTATVVGLSYTFGNGVYVDLADLTNTTIGVSSSPNTPTTPTIWATSGIDTPAAEAQSPPGTPTAGYYLITAFGVSGRVNGMGFMIANGAGQGAGVTYPNGIGNGDNTYDTTSGIEDGGYWELAPTTVPLPAGLPLLLSGLGLVGCFARFARRDVPAALA